MILPYRGSVFAGDEETTPQRSSVALSCRSRASVFAGDEETTPQRSSVALSCRSRASVFG
ncbi:hypothetical protein Acsp06_27130 [Actinomycetospora sp. NBRC 106375]|uniref:hypothetical protein n=1 Tax=Actinomycetospora sp. NBRC 106375 TaxID=3032207 RepID=UPI0024A4757B|nr:hypothetical protein [Actinomycetospora sp. NBRC 106375]GLZ46528.1 hypothetical protein Acsp06_27130 [Actinomycetospora sp. NBRC 106375]